MNEYGGNYAIYHTIRDAQVAATEQQLATLKRNRQQQKLEQQAALEKSAHRRKQGERQRHSGSQSKLLMDAQQDRSENTLSKLKQQHQQRAEQLATELGATQTRLEIIKPQTLRSAPEAAHHSLCLHLSELVLPYVHHAPLTLTVQQGERWHIQGRNGSGKSTLPLRVIAGLEQPISGVCEVHGRCVYLDQHFSLLDEKRIRADQPATPAP